MDVFFLIKCSHSVKTLDSRVTSFTVLTLVPHHGYHALIRRVSFHAMYSALDSLCCSPSELKLALVHGFATLTMYSDSVLTFPPGSHPSTVLMHVNHYLCPLHSNQASLALLLALKTNKFHLFSVFILEFIPLELDKSTKNYAHTGRQA